MKIQAQRSASTKSRSKFIAKVAIGAAIVFASAGFSFEAQARGYGHHYYGGYGGYGYGGYGYHGGYRHGYRRGRHSNHIGYLAGGLVLGSLLTHAYHRDRYPYVVRETRVVRQPRVVERQISRRLFKDRDGNCYERNYSSAGDEIMVELDPAECAW